MFTNVFIFLILVFDCLNCKEEDNNLMDLLLPYEGEHGPLKSHLQIRSVLDDDLFEIFPSSKKFILPLTESQIIVYSPGDLGIRVTTLENPLHTFSVFEPGGDGGCTGDHRTKVTETARLYGCLAASNAGFFNTNNGACYGKIVSDGSLLQNSNKQNVNFGIRQDGTIVVGYLSRDEVDTPDNPFVNLVTGVIWLVRDGVNYVSNSDDIEDMSVQETGNNFINTISARTALGHDNQGRIVLVHVTGKTGQQGLNLYELADFLINQGVINAINLDGGGSMTSVINGTLVSIPSDICPDSKHRCERKVTTIICFHEPFCKPKRDCGGHGECNMGKCECNPGWTGQDCSLPQKQPEIQPELQPEKQPELQPNQQSEILQTQLSDNNNNSKWYVGSAILGMLVGVIVGILVSFGFYLVQKRGFGNGLLINKGNNFDTEEYSIVEVEKE